MPLISHLSFIIITYEEYYFIEANSLESHHERQSSLLRKWLTICRRITYWRVVVALQTLLWMWQRRSSEISRNSKAFT